MVCHSALASARLERYQRHDQLDDLEQSIAGARRALRAARAGAPERLSTVTVNVAHGLLTRFIRLGTLADLEEGIAHLEDVVHDLAPDDPERGHVLARLANAHHVKFDHEGHNEDAAEAARLYRLAIAATPEGDPEARDLREALAAIVGPSES